MQYKHYSEVPKSEWRWKNFTPKEIACKGTGEIIINEDALDCLQYARELYGKPMVINSAYRSISHNKSIGGSKNSRHLNGSAFDIKCAPEDRDELIRVLRAAGFTGIGRYNTFVHADSGREREWDFRK